MSGSLTESLLARCREADTAIERYYLSIGEVVKLINYSHESISSEKLLINEIAKSSVTALCPTRWTVRTGAIVAVINQ